MTFVGVDVGAQRLHVVVLGSGGGVVDGRVLAAADLKSLIEVCGGAECVAIDAPDSLSTAPHKADGVAGGKPLAPKFQNARCAEIGLGIQCGIWVPWATPEQDSPGWMAVGIQVFAQVRTAGVPAIEVYPHAGFRSLAGWKKLAKKTEPAGIAERTDLLRKAGVDDRWLALWSHDALDAALAAVVARDRVLGTASAATCGHDGSAIWLPASLD